MHLADPTNTIKMVSTKSLVDVIALSKWALVIALTLAGLLAASLTIQKSYPRPLMHLLTGHEMYPN